MLNVVEIEIKNRFVCTLGIFIASKKRACFATFGINYKHVNDDNFLKKEAKRSKIEIMKILRNC